MRRRLFSALAVALAAVTAGVLTPVALAGGDSGRPVASAAASSSGPSPQQIRAAVAAARRSPHLWATINICDTPRHRHMLGVRAQMPTLGFGAHLSMRVQVDYWNPTHHAFLPDPKVTQLVRLGVVSYGQEQGGVDFSFPAPGRFRASVTFRWVRNGRTLLSLTRHTTAGHPDADDGDPAHFSAGFCTIS
jgi:hypothetical protein